MPSLIASLRESLQHHAHRSAVEGADWLLSYRDLERESERLAVVLRDAGVGSGHLVPMLMGRSPQFIVAMLAVLRCGAAYAPVDLASPPARQAAMLAALDSPVALVDAGIDTTVLHAAGRSRVAIVAAEVLARPPAASDAPAGTLPWPDTPADAPAYAMFTSGSTGTPKCVLVPHGGIARLVVDADYADFSADARWTQLASLAFDAATLEIWAPLLNGACCVIQELPLPSLDDLADYLVEREITDAWLTAALFNAMVDDRIDALGGLRQLMLGGERISVAHARACLLRWPKVRLINGYGPTENTTFSLCHTITLADVTPKADAAAGGRALQVPIGRPIHGTQAQVVPLAAADADAADDADEWQPGAGELWVAGAGVAIGYLNDPVMTAAKFIEQGGRRWYRTGDVVAERADGVYEFFGRADRQVKIQGHRIELEEVERVLANCPGVGNAVVLVQGDSADSRHLVGCYCGLGAAGAEPVPASAVVRQYLGERLAPKAVPNALHAFERLPLNLNGKVDRVALGRLIATRGASAGEAATDAAATDDSAVAWHTETERQLAAIWSRCLPHARLDRQSHFTHAGGSSLLALRVAADVGRSMQRRLDPLDVLRQPVLAEQARLIDAAGPVEPADTDAAAAPAERPGRRRAGAAADAAAPVQLSRSQKSLLQASRLDASGCAYLVHVALVLPPLLSPARLRTALTEVVARHPMLRTAAALDGPAVSARVLPRLPAGWWRDDGELAAAPSDFDWPPAVLELINQPGDLAADGPMRVRQWSLPGGRHLCVWTVHHFAMDEASIYHALGEVDALLRGEALAPVYGSPFAFEAIETAWTDDAALTAQAAGFVEALQTERRHDSHGEPLPLAMPLPPAPRRGAEAPLLLAADAAASGRALAQAASRWGCTPFTPLVVAYGLALQQVFGPAWRFVLTPFSRRAEPELIEPVGCLLDVRLVEAGARPGETLTETLRRVHGELLDGLQPRFRPLDRLADAVAAIDPALRPALTQFSITWRPERRAATQLAGTPVEVLNVPQTGARFGITLHIEADAGGAIEVRTEAVDEAIAAGRVAALARVFAQQLERLCALPAVDLSPASAASSTTADASGAAAAPPAGTPLAAATPPAVASATLIGHAAAAWQRWLGQPPAGPADHFLGAGGSSLLAMRLAATLRREAGVSLDVAAFLARPTFGGLCSLLAATPRAHAHTVTLVGARNYQRVLLLLPGGEGGPLGMYKLAQELHGRLPEQWAVAIVDLPAIMRRAPDGERSPFFARQLLQVVRDLGEDRIGSIAGFSLGGLLAIDLLNLLAPERAAAIPLWMIDTYAPQRMRLGRAALLQRAAINLLRHPLETLGQVVERLRSAPAGAQRPGVMRDAGIGNLTPKWHAFMRELSQRRFDAGALSATLIHSRSWARTSGLLRHIGTNGFAPTTFGQLRVVVVDEPHFELPRSGAARVAGLITGRA